MTDNSNKQKSEPSPAAQKYQFPYSPKQSIFSGGKFNTGFNKPQRFVKSVFRTQHKGGS